MTNNDNVPSNSSSVTVTNNYNIPDEIFGAWLTKKAQLIDLKIRLRTTENNGALGTERINSITDYFSQLDEAAPIVVSPMLQNHPAIQENKSYRCMVWAKIANKNERVCILLDILLEDLKKLTRPTEDRLHIIIFTLLLGEPLILLSELKQP